MVPWQRRAIGAEIDEAEIKLAETEKQFGQNDSRICPALEELANLYFSDGLYAKCEILLARAVDISTTATGGEVSDHVGQRLASLYVIEGKYDDAETVYLRLLSATADRSRSMADRLCLLSGVYTEKERLEQAQLVIEKAADIYLQVLGGRNSYWSLCQMALADLLSLQGKSGQSEQCAADCRQSLAENTNDVGERVSEENSVLRAALLYFEQKRLAELRSLLRQTVFSDELRLWPECPRAAHLWFERGDLYRAQGMYDEAERAFLKALDIGSRLPGNSHPDELASLALTLAAMYLSQGRSPEAEPPLKLALKTRVRIFGAEHPGVAACIETYAALLRSTKRPALASKLEARARDIRSRLVLQTDKQLTGQPGSM